jgi:hypothetical protein
MVRGRPVRDAVTLAKDAPSPTCVADADCDDGTCTVDSCHPDGCHHETVNPGTEKATSRSASR